MKNRVFWCLKIICQTQIRLYEWTQKHDRWSAYTGGSSALVYILSVARLEKLKYECKWSIIPSSMQCMASPFIIAMVIFLVDQHGNNLEKRTPAEWIVCVQCSNVVGRAKGTNASDRCGGAHGQNSHKFSLHFFQLIFSLRTPSVRYTASSERARSSNSNTCYLRCKWFFPSLRARTRVCVRVCWFDIHFPL